MSTSLFPITSILALVIATLFGMTAFTGIGAHLFSYGIMFIWLLMLITVFVLAGLSFFGRKKERMMSSVAFVIALIGVAHLVLAACFGYNPFLIWPVG